MRKFALIAHPGQEPMLELIVGPKHNGRRGLQAPVVQPVWKIAAGKALKKEMHRQSGRSVRSASGALGGTSGRPGKAINPVTRYVIFAKFPTLKFDQNLLFFQINARN